MASSDERWYFSKEQLENSPSRKCGMDADKELSHRQQAASFIQDMGQRLQVTQLCINTAIVYMHRFYCFHSFTQFHRTSIASAALFLAAKVEEQPRKLEHIIKVAQMCLQKGPPPAERRSELYQEQAQELVINENIMLMTLGFDVAIEHPHAFIVKFCHIANASKDLSQTSYFMASNSLHLTTMCLQYKPTIVACFCIHLSCQWSRWQIPKSKENLPWYSYIDQSVTEELLEQLTNEFLVIFDKCPSRLKKKIQNCQGGQNSMTGYIFDADRKHISNNNNQQHTQASSANKLPNMNNAVIPTSTAKVSSNHAPPPYSSVPSQHHLYRTNNPHGVLPNSAIKPHPAVTGPSSSSSSSSSHVSNSGNHNVFTKDVSQRAEQIKKPPPDVKNKHVLLSVPPHSLAVNNNNHNANKPSHVPIESNHRKESTLPPPAKHGEAPLPAPNRTSFAPSHSEIISTVLKEVTSQQTDKQRLNNSTVKSEPTDEDVKPTSESLSQPKTSKNHSIFSPSPVGHDGSVKSSPFDDLIQDISVKKELLSPELKKVRSRNLSTSSGERELIPIVKKVDDVAGYEDIFNKTMVSVSDFEAPPQQDCKEDRNSDKDSSHAHKKKKKHKEKEKKHDKEKHRHKEKKKHKDDKHRKDHKEKKPSKEHDPVATPEPVPGRIPERIKITIPKERLKDIPAKPKEKERLPEAPVKLKIKLNNDVTPVVSSNAQDDFKVKIAKDKTKSSRKRHRDSDPDDSSKRFAHNGSSSLNNGY